MDYSINTDRGKQRFDNQDACLAGRPDENSCFAVICDGMGGEKAGEIASGIAVKIIFDRIMNGWRKNIGPVSVENLLTSAVSAANVCVIDEAQSDVDKLGMGTTVVAAVVTRDFCVIAHVGDSRAYLINSEIKKLTKDHSYVQTLVDSGMITPLEAERHPKKNYITRALGINEHLDTEFTALKLLPGEKLLLCSDGLTDYVTQDEIFHIVASATPEKAVNELIALANNNGGGDNISVAVISV